MSPHLYQELEEDADGDAHEDVLRRCFVSRCLAADDDVKTDSQVEDVIDYEAVKKGSVLDDGTLSVVLDTHAKVIAIERRLAFVTKQLDGLLLSGVMTVEKIGELAACSGVADYSDRAKKVASKVMAKEMLRTGRAVPGVPFRSNKDVYAVLSDRNAVQRVTTILFAFVPWDRNSFFRTMGGLILHETYVSNVSWARWKSG